MSTLSERTCVALLSGERPTVPVPVRTAQVKDQSAVVKTIQSLKPQDSEILLLQRARSQSSEDEETDEDNSYTEAKSYYEEGYDIRVISDAEWTFLSSDDMNTARSVLRFTRFGHDLVQDYVVRKIQRTKELPKSHEWYEVKWVRQRRERVEIGLEQRLDIKHGTIAQVTGLHPTVDGYQLLRWLGEDGPIISFSVQSSIFPHKRTDVSGARVAFVSEICYDAALYEINAYDQETANRLAPPLRLDWPDISDSEDDDTLTPCIKDSSAEQSVHSHPIPGRHNTYESTFGKQQRSTDAPDSVGHIASASRKLCSTEDQIPSAEVPNQPVSTQQVYPCQQNPMTVGQWMDSKQYCLDYFTRDSDGFKQEVLLKIVQHEDFSLLLRRWVEHKGQRCVDDVFTYVMQQCVQSKVLHEAARSEDTELHWCSEPMQKQEDGVFSNVVDRIVPMQLRNYQSDTVDHVMCPGNYLVAAATNSGKTWIFIEIARRTLDIDVNARIFVIVPRIALTTQHVNSFNDHGFSSANFGVAAFHGDSSQGCDIMLKKSVCVVTADKLFGHLMRREISFDHIDLLILDEAHNLRGKSGYKNIMNIYRNLTDAQRNRTKVVGLTATPAAGKSVQKMAKSFNDLMRTLAAPDANFVNISNNNDEIQRLIPQAKDEVLHVETRPDDTSFRKFICHFIGHIIVDLIPEHLSSLDLSHLNGIRSPTYFSLLSDDDPGSEFHQWRYNISTGLNSSDVSKIQSDDIEHALLLVCILAESVQQSKEVGYELALRYAWQRIHELKDGREESIAQYEAMCHGSLFKRIVDGFNNSAYIEMLPNDVISTSSSIDLDSGAFPKFQKLIEILQEYKDTDDVHGMIFVSTRVGAEQICRLLQQSELRSYLEFDFAIGRGKKDCTAFRSSTRERGLTLPALNAKLAWFKEDGKKVLVTTNVCEEGINVTSCELIVRYNAAKSGTEYTQSKGRARKKNARFISIVEKGSKDADYVRRCTYESKRSAELLANRKDALQL